ncbi:MAG: tetratricopeptide repeat protein [Candidatus Heimdallarchaeota archaeon]|nr:tetratricopeptide repeat protein [Candidatus Heimdallarchaeota archaeon]
MSFEKIPEENEIRKRMNSAEYQNALELTKSLMEKYSKEKIFLLKLKIIQCSIYNIIGNFLESLEIIEETLVECETIKNVPLILLATLEKINSLYETGKIDQILPLINKGENLTKTLPQTSELDILFSHFKLRKGDFYSYRGEWAEALDNYKKGLEISEKYNSKIDIANGFFKLSRIYKIKGEREESLKECTKALKIYEEIGYIKGIAKCLMFLSIFHTLDDLKLSLEYLEKGYPHYQKIGNKIDIARILNNFGVIYEYQGNLNKALEHYSLALKNAEELNNKQLVAAFNHNIAGIYNKMGELDLALKKMKSSLKIFQESGNVQNITAAFNYIGKIYHQKGNLEQAITHFQSAIQLRDSVGNILSTSKSLYNIILVYLDKNDINKAKEYFADLSDLYIQSENKIIRQRTKIVEALIEKNSTRARNRVKAEEILKSIVEEEVIDKELTIDALRNLCELLLYELRQTGNEEVLKEVNNLILKLLDIGKQQSSYLIIAEAYWLQSQIALIQFDFKKSQNLLNNAQKIAEDWGLNRLALRISYDHDRLLEKKDEWDALVKKNASLIERMEISQIEEFLLDAIRGNIFDPPKINDEEPVLLLLLRKNGLPIYSNSFGTHYTKIDDSLFSGFLTAINHFIQEAFSEAGSIERIKYQDYTIIIQNIEPFLVCYVFKGQSYLAIQKLTNFIEFIKNDDSLFNDLSYLNASSNATSVEFDKMIGDIITEIFIKI